MGDSLGPDYFERLYASDPDPWRFGSSAYEHAKYEATIDALPRPRFASCFEVGCSIGVLTGRLAARCDRLLAVDVAGNALAQARARCAGLANVSVEQLRVPQDWPDGTFDLIVLSEVLYYLGQQDLRETARRTAASLRRDGFAILVHWTGQTDYPHSADEAVAIFLDGSELALRSAVRTERYRLDVVARRDG